MKEDFKKFVSLHPELTKYVNNDQMTWQKFYDMFSLYGVESDVWNDYLNKKSIKEDIKSTSVSDIIDALKKVDVETVQKNITTINKALGLIGSLITKDEEPSSYTPRPLYKKFED